MGLAMAIFFAGVGAPVIAIMLAAFALFSGGRISRRLAIVSAVLAVIPFPLYAILLHWIVAAHKLVLEP